MSSDDLGSNLRLLCSYGRSISAVCRQAKINRHQLQRYLSGSAFPSMHTLRRICDFFGVEEHEILLPQAQFAALVRVRPPQLALSRDRASDFMSSFTDGQDMVSARRYEGYYHTYYQPNMKLPEIHRVLTRLRLEDRCLVTKTVEIFRDGAAGLPRVVKYDGIAFVSNSALTIMEKRSGDPTSTFFTILYGTDAAELTFLSGLTLGVAPELKRDIYAMRTCWRYLGREIDVRARLRECGQLPATSNEITKYVRYCVNNKVGSGEEIFSPHN